MKPSRKLKKPDTSSKLILEEIIGLTTKNANGLASSVSNSNSTFAYMAGCVVVVYNVDSGTQSHLMVSNRSPKPLSCIAVSQDGKFLAAGESGHQPAVLVWDCATLASASELKGHQYGVACMAFSPDGKHLVSVGFPQDGYLCLWDWRRRMLVTKLKACSSCSAVASVSFSSDTKFIVTAGKKHLKFWTVGSSTRSHAKTGAGSLTMHGKPVNLGHHKGCSFIAVTSAIWTDSTLVYCNQAGGFPIYALTDSGVLCLLRSGPGLKITNSVDLKVEKGFALSASNKLVACACNNGVIKLFTAVSLKYAGSLQYTEAKRCNKANDMDCYAKIGENEFQHLPTQPDAVACQFLTSEKLVVVYGDHSLYIWEIHNGSTATKCCVLVSHSACIWDIKNLSCENMHDPSLACVARGCPGGVSFATCSADGSIRLWDFALQPVSSEDSLTLATDHCFVITEPIGTALLVSCGIFECDSVVSGVSAQGFRAMAVSSDGKNLAAGDSKGNLHIYNLHTSDYICIQDAHDAEVLSLSFSLPAKKDAFSEQVLESRYLLASGGQDRMIHLYDVERKFDLIGSVDDHSAAVTCVKLTGNGCKILSCSADRSLLFCDVAATDTDCNISRCHHQMASHGIVYDMAIDSMTEVAITVGQDKKVNTFNIAAGKLIRSFKQEGDFGYPTKVTVDPSSSYLVCSYSNRSICMYDLMTGEMVARAVGHGEVITGVIFLPDCKHLVSVDGDGCIFVWKLPAPLSSKMLQRIKENSCPFSPKIKFHEDDEKPCNGNPKDVVVRENSNQVGQRLLCQGEGPQETSAFKFSISRLPKWAQAKVISPKVIPKEPEFTSSQQVGLQASSPLVSNGGEYAPELPESQTPIKHDSEGSKQFPASMSRSSSKTYNSQGTPTPQDSCRSFALDNRWLTIHTVCLDLLNSPEVWDMKDMKVPGSFTNLSQDLSVETTHAIECIKPLHEDPNVTFTLGNHVDGQGATLNDHTRLTKSGSSCNGIGQLRIGNACACHEEVVHETEGRKSSGRRSYSARFVMRRDLLRGQKKLFDTAIPDFGGETRCKDINLHVLLEDPSTQVLEESQRANTCKQEDMKNSTQKLLSPDCIIFESDSAEFSATDKSVIVEVIKARHQEERNIKRTEKQEMIIACKEALHNLDAATENALHLFSKLGSLISKEDISREPEAQLYVEAAEMLPSIAKKVHAVAKLAQSTYNISSGRIGVDVLSFEPLLGTFAESLSQRVVEILKKNCGTL